MEKFLLDLLAMFQDVGLEFIEEPDNPVQTGDKLIGVLPRDLQKWHAVLTAFLDERNARFEEAYPQFKEMLETLPTEPTSQQQDLVRKQRLVHDECDFVASILSLGIKQAFPELVIHPADKGIFICKGWNVVLRRIPKSDNSENDLLVVSRSGAITVKRPT